MKIKSTLRRIARSFGFDIVRYDPLNSPNLALASMLKEHEVDLVIDVGANSGQFGRALREARYKNRIVSFEPLVSAHSLLERSSAGDSNWLVHAPIALGDAPGKSTINVSENSVSSSILPMLAAHSSAAPESTFCSTQPVDIVRLDEVALPYIAGASRTFLKLDVQGYERNVLRGAANILPKIIGVQIEISLLPLYEGQAEYSELIDFMQDKGFQLWSIVPGFRDKSSGRLLQIDGIFFR